MEEELHAEGFDAISQAVHRLYPGQEELHYGCLLPYRLGGPDPLDGMDVWKSERGTPHWHYVTYGFTELYEKEWEDREVSGYGFELTFRLKRGSEETPPVWPMNLLQNLARYVFSSGNVFGSGHHMSCNGPVALETDTKLTALGFRIDPELRELDTPNGHLTFLQAVALTQDEMEGMMCWSGGPFLSLVEEHIPLCVTDLARGSLMERPEFEAAWRRGVEQDGSNTSFLYMDEVGGRLEDGRGRLRLGAGHVRTLLLMLRARVGKGRELYLQSGEQAILFRPEERPALGMEKEDFMVVGLTSRTLNELEATLLPHAGEYALKTMPLTVELIPTRIKDQHGNVTKVIE